MSTLGTRTYPSGPGRGESPMQIAIVLFDRVTALDAIGPYDVLKLLRGVDVRFVATRPGPKITEGGSLKLVADHALAEVPAPDVVVVPGGAGARPVLKDEELLDWLRSVHSGTRWTTSVCFGAVVLGAAGLLDGVRATTHWLWRERLSEYGAEVTDERVCVEGKLLTSAGVSAGIDMALRLVALEAGDPVAQGIQLAIEYDPEPPFDTGSPEKAPKELVDNLRRIAQRREQGLVEPRPEVGDTA